MLCIPSIANLRDQPQSRSVLQADVKEGVMLKKHVLSEGGVGSSKTPHTGYGLASRHGTYKAVKGPG